MTPSKTVLITDLDNTLFDWVDLWYHCFSSMLDQILLISGVPREELIPEISAVHQKHGTSEYAFLIEELPSLQSVLSGRQATQVFGPAIDAYRLKRKKYLKLYPTVAETLLEIRGRGTLIIGYTESMSFYSNYRLRRLGLDGVIEYLFSPEDHQLPKGLSREQLRKYPSEHYDFKYTKQYHTPPGSKKPDVSVLNSIITNLNLKKENCVYLGDSLMKDVAMAKDSGIDDVWAEYGQASTRDEYQLLRQVTHWTAEDVERERTINERNNILPKYKIGHNLEEILNLFEFSNHRPGE